jgi:hypothetical protein
MHGNGARLGGLKGKNSHPGLFLGSFEVGFVEISTNRTSAELFSFIFMMCLSATTFEKRFKKRFHGAIHKFRENHPRRVYSTPVASDFALAI